MASKWLTQLASELEKSTPDRHVGHIDSIAEWIAQQHQKDEKANVSFICTHNSRRSQFAQVWFKVVQIYAGMDIAYSFSGGTEVTACNERTIASLKRTGLKIKSQNSEADNPVYEVSFNNSPEPVLKLWSKVYNDDQNPSTDFAAVMTCDHADQNCPFIPGASIRVPLTYTDPKYADNTNEEAQAYDKTCKIIATDMIRLFNKINRLIS